MQEMTFSYLLDSKSTPIDSTQWLDVFDAMSQQIIFLDGFGVVRFANAVARRWQAIGSTLGCNLIDAPLEISDAQENHLEVLQVARTGVALRGRKTQLHADGRDAWFTLDKIPLNTTTRRVAGVLLIFSDITHSVAARRSLLESEAKYKAFIKNSSDAIWCYELHPPVNTLLPGAQQVDQILCRSMLSECNEQLAKLVGVDGAEYLLGRPVPRNGSLANREDVKHFVASDYSIEKQELLRVDRFGNRKYLTISAQGVVENGFLSQVWGTTRDTTEYRHHLEKMEYLANYDALTQLPNRTFLYNRVEEAISQRHHHQKMALLIIDLDRFKEINDTLGHRVGDSVLQQLGERLEEQLQETTGLVARLGGG